MGKSAVLTLMLFFSISMGYSQGEYNNWHFGLYSSVTFSSGTPVALSGSQIVSNEPVASISSPSGSLLFYTNGITIWSHDHSVMQNGDNLQGNYDYQQGNLIVPKPNSNSIYYLFTLGGPDNFPDLYYSVIDMSLNGGLGSVISRDIPLDIKVTERLTATRHKNGRDFWVISKSLAENKFRVYLVTPSGVGNSQSFDGGVPIEMNDYTGAVRISNDGCHLLSSTRGGFGNPGLIELFDFNNETGTISNGAVTTLIAHPYGIEFSPGSSKFYVGQNDTQPVYQFDISNGTNQQILNAAVPVGIPVESYGFQIAPNNKIYFIRYVPPSGGNADNSLAAIENPDLAGNACSINLSAFYSPLLSNQSNLPNNFNLTYTGPLNICSGNIVPQDTGCIGESIMVSPNPFTTFLKVQTGCSHPVLNFILFNSLGQLVFQKYVENNDNINLPPVILSDGMYYYKLISISDGMIVKTGKLIKSH